VVDPSARRTAFVVLAGGSGTRVGAGTNKVYLPLAGRRVVSWSFVWAREVPDVVRHVLVVRAADVALARETLDQDLPGLPVEIVTGGSCRHESEQAALDLLAPAVAAGELDVVAVHDGARPLAGPSLVRSVLATAAEVGGAVPGLPAEGLLPVDPRSPDGERLVRVQTPQAFRAAGLLAAYAAAARDGYQGTDTASSLEVYGDLDVRIVPGSPTNLKVTYPHDLVLAERLLAGSGRRLR
jgi:2-C-methyl-D-erythritol 4-phosphate cytidylyltransferase